VNYFQAIRILRTGKKKETPQEDLDAAAKVVNERRNRLRFLQLKRVGYSDAEAKNLLYKSPDS
jgi:hypothetical protein